MTATTPTIADFILARVAEDEAVARRRQSFRDTLRVGYEGSASLTREVKASECAVRDPARTLAECEGQRAIVERCVYLQEHGGAGGAAWMLQALAKPYADHPDFDPAWGA